MSKTTVALVGIVILSAGIQGLWSAPRQENPAVLLRAAIEKEEVDGDLNAAIEQYKQVIKIAGANRAVAAQALLRLGGCYEKRGPEEARQAYQQLIRDYAEQSKEVASARQRLAALAVGPAARAGGSRLSVRRVPDLDMFAKPSPDGKFLAFTDWKTGNLAVMDVATGATKALTRDASFGETGGYAEFSVWSRDSRRIAYQWDELKNNRVELRVLSLEGSTAPETITIPNARYVEPLDWSPDGSRILCYYQVPPRQGLMLGLVGVNSHAIEKLDVPRHGWLYQFTADGGAILYSASADGKTALNDIFLRDLKTGSTARVVQHPGDDLLVGVLPGSDWLFFASDRRGRLDLWGVPFKDRKVDGEPVLVKQGLGRFYSLGFSNDGRYYYATLSATDDVYFADFDKESGKVVGGARKFTSRWDGVSSFPSFSPDGGNLAFAVKRGLNPVPVHGTDSLVVQPLKEPAADPIVVGFEEFGLTQVMGPCWLADGKAVVLGGYGGQEGSAHALYRVDLPSLKTTRVYTVPEGRRLNGHACASDGPYVYACTVTPQASQTDEQSGLVVRIDAAGGQEREVFRTPSGQGLSGFSLSPDGQALAIVTSLDRQRRALSIVPSQGGQPRQLVEFRQPSGGGVYSVWGPDGRSVLYIQMSDTWKDDHMFFLRSVRTDGGAAVPETIFRWPGQFFWLKFHPNGRLFAFTGRPDVSTSSEVWVMENLREEIKLLTTPAKRP
jgi:Tol biopolymer transport system component